MDVSPNALDPAGAQPLGRPASPSEQRHDGRPAPRERSIQRRGGSVGPSLSFAQERIWFLHQLDPASAHDTVTVTTRIQGAVDAAALARSLSELVRRHESLRTTFELTDDGPAQLVHDQMSIPLPVTDLSDLPEPEREPAARRLVADNSGRPFDLASGPLIRAALIHLRHDRHILTATLHHIVADTWSVGVILRELQVVYEALAHGEAAPLLPPATQYSDFSERQRESLAGGALDGQIGYWANQLGDGPLAVELPTDRPRPPTPAFRGAQHVHSFPMRLHTDMEQLSQTESTTVFTVLLAALAVLISRCGDCEGVDIGTQSANRTHPDLADVVGHLSNTILLRIDLSGTPTFRALLHRADTAVRHASANQDVPFQQIIETVAPQLATSGIPFTQVALTYNAEAQPTPISRPTFTEAQVTDNGATTFDLAFSATPHGGGCRLAVQYSTELFDAPTVARLAEQLETLLAAAVADPDAPISALPMMTEAQRRDLLIGRNATGSPFPADRCLHELIAERARHQPEAIAVESGGESLTYGELDRRANQLAHRLRELGAGPDIPIALNLPKSLDLVVGALGILKAGSAYLPLDPEYPPDRLALMLADSRAPLIVTHAALADRLPVQAGVRCVCLDRDRQTIAAGSSSPPATGVAPEHLAYVIYTSGSTGRPKGVMVDHRGRVNNFHDFNQRFRVAAGDAVLGLASSSFDMSAYDMLGTLMAGALLVLVDPAGQRDPAHWLDLLVRYRVTVWHSVPALLDMLVTYAEELPDARLPDLRVALLGGDWIPVSLPDRFRALAPAAEVVSLGGATEVSMDSTVYPVREVDPAWRSIPYGHPMSNQRCYVLDSRLQPVPVGVPGDLYLAGVGLGRGYLGNPQLTSTKFVANPLAEESGGRIYHTGDRARWRADGELELLGRVDHQLKIHGWRIEPGEIEATLCSHPAVENALVTGWTDESGERHLVGYVIPAVSAEFDPADLIGYLRALLPAYLVPAFLVPLAELTLNQNGKVDRRALPDPRSAAIADRPVYAAPRTSEETMLSKTWQDLLHVERVSTEDNFFSLGGSSLLAVRVVQRLKRDLGVLISAREIYHHPRLRDLASFVSYLRDAALDDRSPAGK